MSNDPVLCFKYCSVLACIESESLLHGTWVEQTITIPPEFTNKRFNSLHFNLRNTLVREFCGTSVLSSITEPGSTDSVSGFPRRKTKPLSVKILG